MILRESHNAIVNSPDELDMSCFQLPVSFVVHARDVDGYGSVALGIVVGRKVDIAALSHAVFLVDVFGASTGVA